MFEGYNPYFKIFAHIAFEPLISSRLAKSMPENIKSFAVKGQPVP